MHREVVRNMNETGLSFRFRALDLIEHQVDGKVADIVTGVGGSLDASAELQVERRRQPTRPPFANRSRSSSPADAPAVCGAGFDLDGLSGALSEAQHRIRLIPPERFYELAAVKTNAKHYPLEPRRRPQRLDDFSRDVFPERPIGTEAVNKDTSRFLHLGSGWPCLLTAVARRVFAAHAILQDPKTLGFRYIARAKSPRCSSDGQSRSSRETVRDLSRFLP